MVKAQQGLPALGFEVSPFAGYHFAPNVVWNSSASMNGGASGMDISLVRQGFRNAMLNNQWNKPQMGITLRTLALNNPDTFGYAIGLFPTYSFPLLKASGKPLNIGVRVGYGINYNTQGYDSLTNFDNRAISLPLNFAVDAALQLHYHFTSKSAASLRLGWYHVSNGSLKMPNGGINILYGQVGYTHFLRPLQTDESVVKTAFDRKWEYRAAFSVAHRELGYFSYITRFWIASLHQEYCYSLSQVVSVGPAVDVFYDATQPLLDKYSKKVYDVPESEKYYLASGITVNFATHRLFLPVGFYHYVAPMKQVKEPVYLRFGLGHLLGKHFYTGLFFKGTINGQLKLQSDFIEWSIGFRR